MESGSDTSAPVMAQEDRESLGRRLRRALEKVEELAQLGGLPPCLEDLRLVSPSRGSRLHVEVQRADKDGVEVELRLSASLPAGGGGDDLRTTLVQVLDLAERNPRMSFVALKFLREKLLPGSGAEWAQVPEACQAAISQCIREGLVQTEKVPNPRNPMFPVTSAKLNRAHPGVASILESSEPGSVVGDGTSASES
ncbi:MAG: hypothetical protein AAF533_03470 [Acidobacteriota bacterium]